MPTLEWTTPIRRAGSMALSSLPAEIYLEIFEHLQPPRNPEDPPDTRDWRNLAQVCRYFCAAMIPRIFEVVFIDEEGNHSGTSFCQNISDRDETALTAASYVKIFRMKNIAIDHRWSYMEFLSLYAKAISHMHNLAEIILVKTSMTIGLLKAIISRPGLKKLALQGCGARKVRQQLLEQLSRLQIETLHVENLQHDEANDEEYPARAKAFFTHLPFQNITSLKCLCPYILEQILTSPPLLNLQDFHAPSLDVGGNFPDILHKIPHVKRLEIHTLNFPSAEATFTGDLPNFPHLQEVCAPMVILEKLVPGSAISSIEVSYRVHFGRDYDKLLAPSAAKVKLLSKSRRPITSLKVPFSFYTATKFSVVFPALRSLTVQPLHFNYEAGEHIYWLQEPVEMPLTRFLESWPAHPPLYELTLDLLCVRSDNRQHSILPPSAQSYLSDMIPTLRFCTIQYSNPADVDRWYYCEETKLWRLMGGIQKSHSHDM